MLIPHTYLIPELRKQRQISTLNTAVHNESQPDLHRKRDIDRVEIERKMIIYR